MPDPGKNETTTASHQDPPKRLQPSNVTARELFLKSGNLCAFPGCVRLMMNADGDFIGQVCHIEAAETGGERFNPKMSNEERRAFSNLMLLCYEHHVVTDDEIEYTVAVMQQMKQDHENRFSDPAKAILSKILDWTLQASFSLPANLRKVNRLLGWNNSDEELQEVRDEITDLVERLKEVPPASLRVLSLLAARRYRHLKPMTKRSRMNVFNLPLADAQAALAMSDEEFRTHMDILRHHGFAEVENPWGEGYVVELRWRGDWDVWDHLPWFADLAHIELSRLIEELQFGLLDEDN